MSIQQNIVELTPINYMLTIILLIECLFACELNTIIDAGISSDCDLSPIKVFSETEEISFLSEAYTMTTGLVADSLPIGSSLFGQVVDLIAAKTSESDEYVFQEKVNAQFAKMKNCIIDEIKREDLKKELSEVSVFKDIADCNDKFSWGEIEDCLDNDWDNLKEDIDSNFGPGRTSEESALHYSRKLVLYNVLSNGFRFFVTSYLDLIYNTIKSTDDAETFEEECGELYVIIEDAYEYVEIFENWVNDAFESLASEYTANDISNIICPVSSPSDEQIVLNANRVGSDFERKKVYDYPIEGDREFTGYAYYMKPRSVKGSDITPIDGEYDYATNSFKSEFYVNFGINNNGAMCNLEISCNSPVTKYTVSRWGFDKITEYRPNMDSCCALISQRRSQIIAGINAHLVDWKTQQKENYNNIMAKFERLFLEVYPAQDLEELRKNNGKPQCDNLERTVPDLFIDGGDGFIDIGQFRIGKVDSGHFSISSINKHKTNIIFRSDGMVFETPFNGEHFGLWDKHKLLTPINVYVNKFGIVFGDNEWCLGLSNINSLAQYHLSLSYKNPINGISTTARIWRDDGTVFSGPRNDFSCWTPDLPNNVISGAGEVNGEYIQFDNMFRIGETGGPSSYHLSFVSKNVITIYRDDGTIYKKNWPAWAHDAKFAPF